jgi:hypothetical protein
VCGDRALWKSVDLCNDWNVTTRGICVNDSLFGQRGVKYQRLMPLTISSRVTYVDLYVLDKIVMHVVSSLQIPRPARWVKPQAIVAKINCDGTVSQNGSSDLSKLFAESMKVFCVSYATVLRFSFKKQDVLRCVKPQALMENIIIYQQ